MSALQITFPQVLEGGAGNRTDCLWGGQGGCKIHKLEVLRERSQSVKTAEGSIGVKHAFWFKGNLLAVVCARPAQR